MTRYSPTERIGINAVEDIVLNEFGWIFREQPIEDMGIDAHLERVDDAFPDGKLIALQIKTGKSHFREKKDSFIYYGKIVHLDYWIGHSLPVVLVVHFPENGTTLWQVISESTVERTSKGWKVSIPKYNIFGEESSYTLSKIFEGSPAQQKLRKLSIDEPLMRHIERGGKVSISLEEWINKSLGRTPVGVFIYDENGEEILSKDWFQYYTGLDIRGLASAIFPWAESIVDTGFYDCHEDGSYEEEWCAAMRRGAVEENNIGDSKSDLAEIYPYSEAGGEVEFYRLELRLNELGKSFLVLSDHLSSKEL